MASTISKLKMATKTSKLEAANRKVDRMFEDQAKVHKQRTARAANKPMAVKVEKSPPYAYKRGDDGLIDRRAPTKINQDKVRGRTPKAQAVKNEDLRRKGTTAANRLRIIQKHFKTILTGKSGKLTGKK